MLKANPMKFFAFGLVFLLAACNSATASQSAPVKEAPAAAVKVEAKVEEPKVEVAAPASDVTEKPAAMVEEAAAVEQAPVTAAEEAAPVAEESMAKVEETAPVEQESAPSEEQVMQKEVNVAPAGPTEAQLQLLASLEKQGTPPELFNEVWLNSDPLKLADLRGKVVIVEFWTFGCINCKNVVPSLREWHQKYAEDGLVIIGVHTPEFGYEREVENVKQALIDQDIPYSVAIDNDWQTWRAYNNRYWPAKYFVDKAGNLRHIHIGEGRYEQQEEIIQALLAEGV